MYNSHYRCFLAHNKGINLSSTSDTQPTDLILGWGNYRDLHTHEGMSALDDRFYEYVKTIKSIT